MDQILRALPDELAFEMSPSEEKWYEEYLDHNEWRLAFDVLVAAILRTSPHLSDSEFEKLCQIADRMKLGLEVGERLRALVDQPPA